MGRSLGDAHAAPRGMSLTSHGAASGAVRACTTCTGSGDVAATAGIGQERSQQAPRGVCAMLDPPRRQQLMPHGTLSARGPSRPLASGIASRNRSTTARRPDIVLAV